MMYVVDHIRFRERAFKVLQLVGHVRAGGGGGGTLSEPGCGAGRGSGGAVALAHYSCALCSARAS
jgi:hypothetical protein